MDSLCYLLTAIGAYFLGSIPTGYLVGRAKGVDIRHVGSGNIGATNVFRAIGKPAGILVLVIDALKGLAACAFVPPLALAVAGSTAAGFPPAREYLAIIAGVFAILGHNYTFWLWFKGGKGIATSAGVLLALVPTPLLIIATVWTLVFTLTRFVSLGSIAASFSLPFAVWATGGSTMMILLTAGLALLAIYKHRANIQRLLKGSEHRIQFRHKERPS